jgi:hypothetical protein
MDRRVHLSGYNVSYPGRAMTFRQAQKVMPVLVVAGFVFAVLYSLL